MVCIEQPFSRTKAYCCRGHALSAENLTTNAGVRVCRLCRNEREAERRARLKAGISKKVVRSRQTHCKRGHELTEGNTYIAGGRRICRECRRAYKQWATKTGKEFIKREWRTANLKKYGLTPEQYDAILSAQGGVCAICKTNWMRGGYRHLDVDHDHTTGKVRGLLCGRCNRGLGYFKDNPQNLAAAIDYLRTNNQMEAWAIKPMNIIG